MSEGFWKRWSQQRREIRERDENWLRSLDLTKVNRALNIMFVMLVMLNLIDVSSTLVAISRGSTFQELNPIASALFGIGFPGFLLALVLKYSPFIPIVYGVFVKESERHAIQVRSVKLATLIVLAAANIVYVAVVVNNLAYLAIGLH